LHIPCDSSVTDKYRLNIALEYIGIESDTKGCEDGKKAGLSYAAVVLLGM